MDPPGAMIDGGAFPGGDAGPYSLADIWQSPAGGGLGLGRSIGQFLNGNGANLEASGGDPASAEARRGGGGDSRKRRDAEEELTARSVSTSNGVVFTIHSIWRLGFLSIYTGVDPYTQLGFDLFDRIDFRFL